MIILIDVSEVQYFEKNPHFPNYKNENINPSGENCAKKTYFNIIQALLSNT